MEFPRLDNMSNQQLIIILVGLLIVFGLVSALMMGYSGSKAELGGCCPGTMVVNKNRNNAELFQLTYWTIEKYAENNNLVNASNDLISYEVNVTELETENSTLVLHGFVTVKNTGKQTAYLGNVVLNLLTKNGGWKVNVTDVADYYGSTTVETCKLTGSSGTVIYSEGPGSGDIRLTDPNGNNPFALNGLYPIPGGNNPITFNYSASFNLTELNLTTGEQFREEIILTFINAPSGGGGACTGIDADGDGSVDSGTQSEHSWDSPSAYGLIPATSDSTWQINVFDQISSSPDSSIVTVPDFTINYTGILNTDGTNVWTELLNATGTPGTVTTIPLNSTATCADNGTTFIRNKAWIDAADMSVISGSPTYSQIAFYCGEEPPNITIGDICTFTQDSYGGLNTTGFNIMKENATFPLVVGNNGGPYTLTLTTAQAAQDFLPQNGTPSYLTATLTDPGKPPYPLNWSTSAKQFAGEVVALQLNVDLSDSGKMPQNSSEIYGNRTVKNTLTSLDGKRVRDVLAIANCLLANGTSCDGYTTANISMVNGVLVKLNMNYYNCENDWNWTGPEDNTPPVIWSVEAIPDLLYGGQNYIIKVNVTDDVKVDKVNVTVNNTPYDLTDMGGDIWQITVNAPPDDGTYTIYVSARDAAYNWASDSSESIVVDALPPQIVLELPLQSGDVITPGTLINLTITDAHLDSAWYSRDGGLNNVSLPSPFDINTTGWAEGTYTINVWANDTVGNLGSATYTFIIDLTSPTVSVSANPTTTSSGNNVTFDATVTDSNLNTSSVYLYCKNSISFNVQMTCSGTSPNYNCQYNWTATNDGNYTCNVTATDLAGNSGTSSNINVIIDSTPPTITLNSPTPSGSSTYIQPGDQINLTVTNGVYDELDSVWYSTDGGSTNTTLSSASDPLYYITTSGECVHTYDVWAKDTAGNVQHEQYIFNQDGIDPKINSVTATPSTMYTGDTYHLEVNATDNKAMHNVSATINSVLHVLTFNSSSGLWEAYPSAPGVPGHYTIYVDAYDKAGNDDSKSNKKIKVNAKPGPSISLYSPTNGATIPNTTPVVVNISKTLNDLDAKWYYSSNNPTNRSFDSVSGDLYTINLSSYPDGTYTFYIFANDTANIVSNATYWFTIDSTAPVVTSLTANDTIFPTNTNVNFTAYVTETISLKNNEVNVTCTLNSHEFSFTLPCSGGPSSYTCSDNILVSESDGVYYCTATAEDNAGNSGTSSALQIIIDSTPPTITVNSPLPIGSIIPAGTLINFSVTNGVYDQLDTVRYRVDGGSYQVFTSPYDINTTGLSYGWHCFKVKANDTAGNSASKTACYLFDSMPPVIHWVQESPHYITPGGQFNLTTKVTDSPNTFLMMLFGTVKLDIGNLTYSLGHTWWPPSKWTQWKGTNLNAPSGNICGNFTKTITATDLAGNNATDNSTQIAVVGCKPTIILLSPPDGSTITKGTTLDFMISHPFPVTANYTYDGVGPLPFTSPYDIPTSTWEEGKTYSVYIEAVDQYGYDSNGTFTFTVFKGTPPGPNGDKKLKVSAQPVCPGDQMKFTVTYKGDGKDDVDVKLVYFDDSYDPPLASVKGQQTTDGNGVVTFSMSNAGSYKAYVSRPGYKYDDNPYEFTYTMCPPIIPPPGPECDDDVECPSGYECVNGSCIKPKPECTDDTDCADDEQCVAEECEPVKCTCGYVSNHACVSYECCADSDCAAGYVCKANTCEGVPDIDGELLNESVVVTPGEDSILAFQVSSNGTAPIHNIRIIIQDQSGVLEVVDMTPSVIPVLNPGESTGVVVSIKIGEDALPGSYPVLVVYDSNEVSESDQFATNVSEAVTPGIIWEQAALCLVPLLILAALALIYWMLTRKKVVTDEASLKEIQKSGKLGFAKKYYVSEITYAKLGTKLKEKCVPVKVSKTRVQSAMKEYGLSEADATLMAIARKIRANRVLSVSKTFSKYAKAHRKVKGIKFLTPEGIQKPKKGLF